MARRCPPRLHFRRLDTLTCTWQLFGKTIEQFDSPVNGAQDRRSIGVVPWVRHAAKKGGLHFAAFLTPYPLAFHTLAHSRSGILWDLHSSRASGRRAYCHFQRLGHAEEQRGSGPWPGRSEKSELEEHFSQRLLSADLAAYCRSRLDFHGHHTRGK